MAFAPAIRQPASVAPVPPIQSGVGVAAAPAVRTGMQIAPDPYGSGDTWHYDANTGKFYAVDANNRFTGGNDPEAYASWYAGVEPNGAVGQYQDAQSIYDKEIANSNYGANLANNDAAKNNLSTNFAEILNNINKNKTKSLASLADSVADRGLTQSGIFLKSTDDTNDRFNDQVAGQTRSRDQQFNTLEQERVGLANLLNQQLVEADRAAYGRALQAWTNKRDSALQQARERLGI